MSEKVSHRKTDTFKFSNSGERFRSVYELDLETEIFIEKGRVDLDEYINSGFADVDLYTLIERYKTVDDVVSANAGAPFYGDVTEMPKTMFDLPPSHVLADMVEAAQKVEIQPKEGGRDLGREEPATGTTQEDIA
nr:MAG: internal scaffolding protein [Microvirus sp.]